jgi:hypothetical protein
MNAQTSTRFTLSRRVAMGAAVAGAAAVATVAGLASAVGATGSATASGISVSGTLYGDPGWAVRYWWAQSQNDCTLASSADIVGQSTGREPTEAQVLSRAETLGLYDPTIYDSQDQSYGGGPITQDPSLIVKLLRSYGVASGFETGQSMAALEQDLQEGRGVIAGVDAQFIWNVTDPGSNPANDQDPYQQDHALVVTGVNTATGIVSLNDSGDPIVGRGEQVPIAVFAKAWAAPFQTAGGQTIHDVLIVTSGRTQVPAPAPTPAAHGTSTTSAGSGGHGSGATSPPTAAGSPSQMEALAFGGAAMLALIALIGLMLVARRTPQAPAWQ